MTLHAGQLGFGTMAACDDMSTTRPTPQSFAARRTLSVPFTAGSSSSFCLRGTNTQELPTRAIGLCNDRVIDHGERIACLRIFCLHYHRRRQVEDTVRAFDGRPNGSGVDEVHLEQPETRVGAAQGLQVLRLALIFCTQRKPNRDLKKSCSVFRFIRQLDWI